MERFRFGAAFIFYLLYSSYMSSSSSAKNYPTTLSTPIDRSARRVISKGINYTPKKINNLRESWDTAPPLLPPPSDAVKSLFGTRKGSLIVVGYLGASSSSSARLLVRCDCGMYEVRLSSRWRKHSGVENYCQFCEQLQRLKLLHLSDEEKSRESARLEKLRR